MALDMRSFSSASAALSSFRARLIRKRSASMTLAKSLASLMSRCATIGSGMTM